VSTRPKVLEFEVALDRDGALSAEGCPPIELPEEWTAEHLFLAALARCSLTSLRYHARRANIQARASAASSGVVTKRQSDERFAFVEIECRCEVELEPLPGEDEVRELVAKAERDCFIGASVTAKPRYAWRVNGTPLG
jgi:organic hydroperoxide reductase OsmC/OhrA